MVCVLHLIEDAEHPWGIVAALMTAMLPGSYLTISRARAHPAVTCSAPARPAR